MSYVGNHLTTDEKLLHRTHLHWIVFVLPIVLSFAITPIGLLYLVVVIIKRVTTELGATNKRIVGKKGFISIQAMDSPLDKINNVKITQGVIARIFNYGTIEIDTTSGVYLYKQMANPAGFKRSVTESIEIFEDNNMQKQADKIADSLKRVLN